MPKPKKTQRDEPKNFPHGQAEQHGIESPGGKGTKSPTARTLTVTP
jgi:hypothetical protein